MAIVLCVFLMSLTSGLTYAQFAGGTGTESDPWLIETRAQLEQLHNYLGIEHTDKYFKQIADIDLGGAPWNPIGRTFPFYGQYDGDGCSIHNLHIADYFGGPSGFFAGLEGAIVQNLSLTGVSLGIQHDLYQREEVSARLHLLQDFLTIVLLKTAMFNIREDFGFLMGVSQTLVAS